MLPPKKNSVKTPVKDKEKVNLTPSEQKAVNKDYERAFGKLPKGENAKISENFYNDWKKTGKLSGTYYNPSPAPVPVKRTEIGKLPTKKATEIGVRAMPKRIVQDVVISSPKKEKKFVPEAKTKKLTKGGEPVIGRNIATGVKNIIGKSKFEMEKKQAAAGKRALRGTGESGTYGNERIMALKEQKQNLKEARKATGVNVGKSIRDINKGIRYEKKVLRGKNRY